MSWYKSGTVSVAQNSNAVIGTGTAFIANGRVGDAFIGPDGVLYEVTNIASDTAMSIAPNYKGATNAAGTYVLAPMQGYVKDTADALREASVQVAGALDGLEASVDEAAASAATATNAKIEVEQNATVAAQAAAAAHTSETNAAASASGAAQSAATAVTSATGALASKNAAAQSASEAAQSASSVANALLKTGGTMSGALNEAPVVNLASSTTPAIGAAAANSIKITGTTTITGFDAIGAGAVRTLVFSGVLTLTHNPSSLILPGGANITTAVNDSAKFLSLGGGSWICVRYSKADGKALVKDFAFDRSNILGTVSQAGGIPTGAIFETGSNANGTYIKYADGTLICTNITIYASVPMTSASIGIFYGPLSNTQNYPATFVAIPSVWQYFEGTGAMWAAPQGLSTITAWGPLYPFSDQSRASTNVRHIRIAIGRWFQ